VLDGKRLGGNKIHISDWERWLAAFAAAVTGVGEKKPEGAVAAIRETAVAKAVCGDWDVLYSPRVRQDPRRARRLLGIAVARALGEIGGKDALEVLGKLEKDCSDDAEIVAACAKARSG
jgi:hypothetical protein